MRTIVLPRRLPTIATALALAAVAFLPTGPGAATAQDTDQERHAAYGGCLPHVDDLDCAEIGYAVLEVWDIYDDPYGLDDA